MGYWLTSKNKKRHQRAINKLIRDVNKAIEKDDLWFGRFYVSQVYSPQWYIYEDGSGAEYFVHLKFIDKCTGREYICANIVNHWCSGNGWRLWEKMNWFIIEHCDVWNEPLALKRDFDAWRKYNKTIRKVK